MKEHVFVGSVLHSGLEFKKGQACPADLLEEMLAKGLVAPLPEALKPVEPKALPKAEMKPKASK